MVDFEDLEPRKQPPKPRDLSSWGVAELNAYIANLQAEIDRAQAVIAGKQAHRAGADALFKKK
jgi:uncharacterized small protein (DUF1192 family)